MKKKSGRLILLILIGITAISCIVNCVLGFIFGKEIIDLTMRAFTAVLWVVGFFVYLHRYCTQGR